MVRQTESMLHAIAAFKDLETTYLRVTVAYNGYHLHDEKQAYESFDEYRNKPTRQCFETRLATHSQANWIAKEIPVTNFFGKRHFSKLYKY